MAQAAEDPLLTTVIGAPPADLEGLEQGPAIEGFISAKDGDAMRVIAEDGSATVVRISPGTSIKATGGFLGLGRTELTMDSLLDGLPVKIDTVQWAQGLVARSVRFSKDDYETALLVNRGTSRQFAQQGAAIEKNTLATEALRSRFGAIDQYNVISTTNVYFDTGKSNLSPEARGELCAAATQAQAIDNALLLVVGYTDSTGTYEINQELSEKRAGRVVNYLQQQCGWQPWRMLTPTGMAEADPAADNTTAYGKAQNRRVAVNVLVSKSVDGYADNSLASADEPYSADQYDGN
jgi:outer membrane protein OmpA-like peptidoglycan-associated protein